MVMLVGGELQWPALAFPHHPNILHQQPSTPFTPLPSAPPLVAQLVEALRPFDDELSARLGKIREAGMVGVHLGCVDVASGSASVKLTSLPPASLLARCEDNENVVAFRKTRQQLPQAYLARRRCRVTWGPNRQLYVGLAWKGLRIRRETT